MEKRRTSKLRMNYNNRKFRVLKNSSNGETNGDIIFIYKQKGSILSCEYEGGDIVKGHLLGKVDEFGTINMRYHQINTEGELRTGLCTSTPKVQNNGKIRLFEEWEWTKLSPSNFKKAEKDS